MPPSTTARKRIRKRKRRAASSSSSSSSSDNSSSEAGERVPSPKTAKATVARAKSPSSSSSSSTSSSSKSESESGSDAENVTLAHNHPPRDPAPIRQATRGIRASPSPSPPPITLPSFILSNDDSKRSREMREKFQKFWMASIADGFRDDLEQIRKEPNMNTTKLTMLIDSLATGADVFSSEKRQKGSVNEVDVALE